MTKRSFSERFKGIYFGWYTVLAGAVISCWGYGSWHYGMSALFKPLLAEYGWTFDVTESYTFAFIFIAGLHLSPEVDEQLEALPSAKDTVLKK